MGASSPAQIVRTLRSVLRFREIEWNASARRLRSAASVEDLRLQARRRLPGGVFDYIDGAAEDEATMAANRAGFGRIGFRPRVLRDVSYIDPSIELLGVRRPTPMVLAPTGFTRIAHPAGELAVARAAGRAGVPYVLSTLATRSIEEVAAVSPGPLWFQVYVWRDRALVASLIDRAAAAGYEALVLTVDTAVFGRRERDVRRGYTLPPKIGVDTILDGVRRPAWTWALLNSEPITFANVTGSGINAGESAVTLSDYVNSQFDPTLSWDDIDWVRDRWDGPILCKGIATAEDAELAVERGVDGIMISNHGGRQLEGAPAPIDIVAEIVHTVAGRADVLVDGGIRRGRDIVKALALGATACSFGRPYLYGLGAAGEAGVDHVLDLFDGDIRRTMALLGVTDVGALGIDLLDR